MENKSLLNVWAKTLLSVYRYLDTVNSSIDDLVLKQGLSRGFSGGRFYSTYEIANKMIALTERKKVLLRGAHIIEDSLARLKTNDVRLLMFVFFDLLKSQKCAELLDVSIRTFFRRKKLAIESFASSLKFLGYSAESLSELFKAEGWLINLFKKNYEAEMSKTTISNGDEVNESIYEYALLKSIINDLNYSNSRKTAVIGR